ncbi:MAG: peptidoglycan DD-metalloendopeptidase family protein [Defluviitaleaceae bacterium]|nr:peptidoglycan DD-metalloendopeptidase family protein [Defluviitaleaceae bacterium]
MFKKVGISVLLAFTILATTAFHVGTQRIVYATSMTCNSIPECRERQQAVQDTIAQLLEEAEELGEDIAEIQIEITALRGQVSELEAEVSVLESAIMFLTQDMADLAEEIYENLALLEETEERIAVLIDEVAQRMRITQRVNNRNSMLAFLSEAENLMDFIRRARTFSQLAAEDAARMNELNELIAAQEQLLIELDEQTERLQMSRTHFEMRRANLEAEQLYLEQLRIELSEREAQMQDKLYRLHEDRHDEEALLAALEEAEEILRRTPPPPVTTNTTSNALPGMPQTPNASGLAHPMPGSRVSDEFGTRGGTHRGIDLVVIGNPSAPILAAASGTVITNAWEAGFGYYVIISHHINGQRVDTLYAHLRYAAPVPVGTVVAQGQVVGTKGSTGMSSGPHLHFEVHPGGISWGGGRGVNPRDWINF